MSGFVSVMQLHCAAKLRKVKNARTFGSSDAHRLRFGCDTYESQRKAHQRNLGQHRVLQVEHSGSQFNTGAPDLRWMQRLQTLEAHGAE